MDHRVKHHDTVIVVPVVTVAADGILAETHRGAIFGDDSSEEREVKVSASVGHDLHIVAVKILEVCDERPPADLLGRGSLERLAAVHAPGADLEHDGVPYVAVSDPADEQCAEVNLCSLAVLARHGVFLVKLVSAILLCEEDLFRIHERIDFLCHSSIFIWLVFYLGCLLTFGAGFLAFLSVVSSFFFLAAFCRPTMSATESPARARLATSRVWRLTK